MNILYFGSDVFLSTFEYLLSSEHTIAALYTYHEETEYIREEQIKALAQKHGIPVHYERITLEMLTDLFHSGQIDLVISAEYDRKIPVPDIPGFYGINIHNSLLPEGRGYFPIEMRLFHGYDYGGVTIHKLASKIDHGDILIQEKFDILPSENDRDIYKKCSQLACSMVQKLLADFDSYWALAVPQTGQGSYWNLPIPQDYTVKDTMSAKEISHIYRSFGRFTQILLDGNLYHVEHLSCHSLKDNNLCETPVSAVSFNGSVLQFQAKDCMVTAQIKFTKTFQ